MRTKIIMLSILLIMLILSVSTIASAEASNYFISYCSSIKAEGNGKILISFEVFGTGKMTSIGVTEIEVQKKVGTSWVYDRTLTSSSYPSFLTSNSSSYFSQVRITGVTGTQYRAILTFYAANSSGSESKNQTSNYDTCY